MQRTKQIFQEKFISTKKLSITLVFMIKTEEVERHRLERSAKKSSVEHLMSLNTGVSSSEQ